MRSSLPTPSTPRQRPAVEGRPDRLELSAVIVTYNSDHRIDECLRAVRAKLGDIEVLVVDNESGDDTLATARGADLQARLIPMERNAGYGSACNRGVKECSNEHVILMNPDVVIEHADVA